MHLLFCQIVPSSRFIYKLAKIVTVGLLANLPYTTDSIKAQIERELNHHRFPDAFVESICLVLVVSVFPDAK